MRRTTTLLTAAVLALAAAAPAAVGVAAMPRVTTGAPRTRVPPPTPVPPFGSPSPFPTELDTPQPSDRPPEVEAAAVSLIDLDTGQTLFARDAGERRAVASLTKIVTALIVLRTTRPNELATVSPAAASQTGAVLGLEAGERIPVRELLYGLLLSSANDAAVALAEHVSGGVGAFVERMNFRVRRLGLRDTQFASPNGLDDAGYSTAADMAFATVMAFREPLFKEISETKFHTIPAPRGEPRRIQNRNALLWLYPDAIGVKTGFTSQAGFCLVGAARRGGLGLAAVVLGAPGEAFSETATLLDYGFERFERETVFEAGQRVRALELEGVRVPVLAEETLELVVPTDREVHVSVEAAAGVTLPVEEGERVGVVVARAGNTVVGEAPLLAAIDVAAPALPPEPPAAPRPWWRVVLDTAGRFLVEAFRAIFG